MGARAQQGQNLAALHYAMLSVYYGSLGRELALSGAPAMLLPLQVRPMGLERALSLIGSIARDRLRDAVWRVVRSVPPPHPWNERLPRYPAALEKVLAGQDLGELDEKRKKYAKDASLFAAAATAHLDEHPAGAPVRKQLPPALVDARNGVLGMTAAEAVADLQDAEARQQLRDLEEEVGVSLSEYVAAFADVAAFDEWWKPQPKADEMVVYPATCVIRQNVENLMTTITVSAFVRSKFETLEKAADPGSWADSSDVITKSKYVRGPYELEPPDGLPPVGNSRMLEEQVNVYWGVDESSVGAFHNVLRIETHEVRPVKSIDVEYSLARSIDSRILWDARPGGLLVDQGFIKVRPLVKERWRVTSRKTVLFSDRTPNSTGPGWFDFGQMLNYLAPAALTWWLESELYSAAHY